MPDRVVVLARRRDPRELMLLALCLMSGVSFVAGTRPPTSVQQVMPAWLVTAWYVLLAAAGAVGIAGNLWPGRLRTALLIRLSGQVLAAGPAAAYAVALFAYTGSGALLPGLVVAAWSGICLWTAAYLRDDLRLIGHVP
jgi:hypothetical protein